MSTLPHILPTAKPGAQGGEGEPTSFPEAQTGVPGVFEKLVARALSASPAENAGQGNQKQVVPQPNLKIYSNPAEATAKATSLNTAIGQINAVQPDGQISSKPVPKTASDSKTEKNSQAQSEPVAVNISAPPEIAVNQMLAAAMFAVNPVARQELNTMPEASMPSGQGKAIKPAAIGVSTPQSGKQMSPTATKISASDLSEDKVTPTVQPIAATKAGTSGDDGTESPAKNSEALQLTDTTATAPTKAAILPVCATPEKSSSDTGPSPPSSELVTNGTSAANQDISMQQAEKTNKIAGQEKVLPGDAVSAARGSSISTMAAYAPHTESLTGTVAADNATTGTVEKAAGLPADAVAVPVGSPVRSIVERTQEMVTMNAVRLSDSGNSSMQVVIKPDAGTELSLELRQRGGGGVEVQAVLQQGDFNHLSQQWPELQQRLEQRGVRLAPLSDEGAAANNGGSQETFQQKQNQTAGMVPEIALADAPTGMLAPAAAQSPAHRGWETWA